MEAKVDTMLIVFLLSILVYIYFVGRSNKRYSGRLPPGSLGLPLIGQSFEVLKALKADKVDEWFKVRIAKHGPIWKTNLFGYPTVVLHGTAANKFVYTYDGSIMTSKQPPSVSRIWGANNIVELTGNDHKRVRAAMVSFLKIEVLKQYVAEVDQEIQIHLQTHWNGHNEVQVQPLMKTLTFDVICSLLFGIERGARRWQMVPLFQDMMESILAIPLNLPFTQFNRGLKARKNLVKLLQHLLSEKRVTLKEQKQQDDSQKDLIISFLNFGNDGISAKMTDEEIIDNIILVMAAGYDTTSVLLTILVQLLANDKSIYSNIVQEQEEIARSKGLGEGLTWEDLNKMKYTWRVASETLGMYPPLNLTFRRAAKDIEYGGYIIPKGWQVMFSASMTHMDDSIFHNPTVFDPARFNNEAPTPPPFGLVAFGAGPRMCPGMELAKMETLVMIHRLVTTFKWELVKKDEFFERIPLPEFEQGLLARIRPLKRDISDN
ncbi:cytochrome P450 716B2-like [Rutidosis leptorrhynchoides]|uniref:cytochrome P450 716B2-like n=1 Tax=Rutidosis leptorrhynchoides TaxID=125765 RepID=UPI003A99EF8A